MQSRVFVVRIWSGSPRFHATVREVTSDKIAEFSDGAAMLEFMARVDMAQALDPKPPATSPTRLAESDDDSKIDKHANP